MSGTRLSARSFWRTVTKEVRRTASDCGWQWGDSNEREYAFQRWIAEIVRTAEPDLTTAPEDALLRSDGLSADLIFENHEGKRLLLIKTKFQPRGRAVTEHPVSVFFGRHDKFMNREWVLSHGSGIAAERLASYEEMIDNGYSVSYYFISTGDAAPRLFDLARSCSDRYAEQGLNITCKVFDLRRLKDYYERSLPVMVLSDIEGMATSGLFARVTEGTAGMARDLCRRTIGFWRARNVGRYLSGEKDIKVLAIGAAVAVAALLAGTVVQLSHDRTQVELRRYDVAFDGIEKGYAGLLEAFTDLRGSSLGSASVNDFIDKTRRIEARYFAVEPFLKEKPRAELWKIVQSYIEESRKTRVDWEVARQKKNPHQREKAVPARSLDDQEEMFLAYRAKLRDLFLKTMMEMR